jgi:hypothetical protein
MVTTCTTRFRIKDYALCPHTEFVCFVCISEQTVIISLYSINWLVFITQTERVYCAVRSTFYVLPTHTEFVCSVCISQQTAIISVHSIYQLLFYHLDRTCLQRGTDCVLKCDGITPILQRVKVCRNTLTHFVRIINHIIIPFITE